jgi:thymidylate kinase
LVELFAALDQQRIRWLLLRGETELATLTGDVDLLVDPRDLTRARNVFAACDYLFLPTYGRGSHRFYVSYHVSTNSWITLDIVTEMTYGRYLNLRSHAAIGCLAHRQGLGPLYVFAQSDRFWALFLHCMLDKGRFAPHRAARLHELAPTASDDGSLARHVAMACPEGWNPARVMECVAQGDWDSLTRLAPSLATGWGSREPLRSRWWVMTNRALQLLEIVLIRLRRPGLSVALLGPDGSGKSSLTEELQRSFHIPVRAVYMGLWKNDRKKPGAKGLGQGVWLAQRGLEIVGRFPKAWEQYLLGLTYRALGRLVIFDRYVYDALVTAHSTSGRLKRLYMWVLGHACPAPDLVLVLDAPGEVMFARKGEHNPETLEIQRQGLLALRDRIPNVEIIDATHDKETVRADVFDRIWSAYRTRFGGGHAR